MITKKIFAVMILVLFFFIIQKTVYFFNKEKDLNQNRKIYPNVYINKLNLGEKTESQIIKYFEQKNKQIRQKNFIIFYQKELVGSFSAKIIDLHFDSQRITQHAFLIGRNQNLSSKIYQKITTIFGWQKFTFNFSPTFNYQPINEFLETAKEKYNQPAKNAQFKFENNKVVVFTKEIWGKKINQEKFIELLEKEIKEIENKKENNINLILPIEKIEPEIKLHEINQFGIREKIGVGKSDYSGSISQRIHNIILAASKFNGILVAPQKIISFNETVGAISSLTGYQPAYIIKDGKTILGDGGGVCQVSTTLFRAALNAGLPIIERQSHAYRISYYENDSPPGFDATVFTPIIDLKIKNDTKAYILIQTEIDKEKNLLYFYLFGKKDNRQIEISKFTVWDIIPPLPPKYQDDPTLKKGVIKQIDFPASGAKTNFNYRVSKDGKIIFEKNFFSLYQPWQAIYLVGTAE